MMHSIEKYKTLVFDCDGVVLDSNQVKTEAFFHAALPYGEPAAQALVDYHVAHGGVSRYQKFSYFLSELVPIGCSGPGLDGLLKRYAEQVCQGLLNCEIADGLGELRNKTRNTNWLMVSGSDQAELREILAVRNLSHHFDGGIFGSPESKDEILSRELAGGGIIKPALFLGDSKYDYEAASRAGLDFVFLSGWSEVSIEEIQSKEKICTINSIAGIL